MKDKRIVNFRVIFFAFVGLMMGIIFSRLFLYNSISLIKSLIIIFSTLFLFLLGIVYALKMHKRNIKTVYRKDVSPMMTFSIFSLIIMFIVGVCFCISPLIKIANLPEYKEKVEVTGVVSDYVADNTTYKKFILDKCKIVDDKKNIDVDFKICIYTTQFADIQLGNEIYFIGNLEKFRYNDEQDFSKLIQNIGYSAYINFSDITISEGKKEVKDIVKNNVYEVLHDNLNYDNANISYGILFGEKQGINQEITNMFSYSGISHILAVSGLHVGVLVGILQFLLSKIKKGKYLKLIFLSLILLFYAYLCSFTPSVCRASIMAVISMLCSIMGEEYDILSSLSLAGIIILLFSPLSLFSLSFQLSFLCVFSIIAFAPTIKRLFKKIKLPEFLAAGFAISMATNIVLLPLCANIFTRVSLLGVIVNIFVLPLFSIVYVLLFVLTFLSIIVNLLGVILVVPNMFLHLIKVIADFSSSVSFGIFKLFNMGYLILFLTICFCLILHFLMIKFKFKSFVLLGVLISVVILGINTNIEKSYYGEHLLVNYQRDTNVVFYIDNNNCTLIGSMISKYNIDKFMKENRLRKIDNLITYDLTINNLEEIKLICEDYGVGKIYIPMLYENNEISKYFGNVEYYEKLTIGRINFENITYLNKVIGINIETESLGNFVLPAVDINKSEGVYLTNNFGDVDYWVVSEDRDYYNWEDMECKAIYCHNESDNLEKMKIIKDINIIDFCLEESK